MQEIGVVSLFGFLIFLRVLKSIYFRQTLLKGMNLEYFLEKHEEVLVSLRQIIRAIGLYSKKLSKESGLTGPQLILMRSIKKLGNQVTIRQLSNHTNVSPATATTILDRLERNGLVIRVRSTTDKRKVHANITEKGALLLESAPLPLQDSFINNFHSLDEWEQSLLLSSVQRIASMMNAESYKESPVLDLGEISSSEVPPKN